MSLDHLLRDVLAAPDRDGPRRRYADALSAAGDELGEYIQLSLDVDRNRRVGAEAYERRLALHNRLRPRMMAPLVPWIRSHAVDRGLVARVEMDATDFLAHGEEVFAHAPVQHVDLVGARPVFAELVASPLLARVQTLGLGRNELQDDEARLLAASPHVRGLQYLDLSANRIGPDGLDALAASPHLHALRLLHLEFNPVENPVSRWSSDGVSGLVHQEGASAMQVLLRQRYGERAWMAPPANLDRYRMCDAGE